MSKRTLGQLVVLSDAVEFVVTTKGLHFTLWELDEASCSSVATFENVSWAQLDRLRAKAKAKPRRRKEGK